MQLQLEYHNFYNVFITEFMILMFKWKNKCLRIANKVIEKQNSM